MLIQLLQEQYYSYITVAFVGTDYIRNNTMEEYELEFPNNYTAKINSVATNKQEREYAIRLYLSGSVLTLNKRCEIDTEIDSYMNSEKVLQILETIYKL